MRARSRGLTDRRGVERQLALAVLVLVIIAAVGAATWAQESARESEGTGGAATARGEDARADPEVVRELVKVFVWVTVACFGLLIVSVYYTSRRVRRQLKRRPRPKSEELTDLWFENPIERGGRGDSGEVPDG